MAYRPLPRFSQTNQPQYAAGIEWENPLTSDLRIAFNSAVPGFEFVRGRQWENLNGATTATPRQAGIAVDGVSSSTAANVRGYIAPERSAGSASAVAYEPTAPPLTLFGVGWVNTLEANAGILQRPVGSGTPSWGFGVRAGASSRGPACFVNCTGGTLSIYPTGTAFPYDLRSTIVCAVAVIGPTTTTVYAGPIGRIAGSNSGSTPSGNFTYTYDTGVHRTPTLGGGFAYTGSPATAGAVWREWAEAEVVEYFRNPWQIFRPPSRRLWLVPSSGGGGSYDVAAQSIAEASSAANITSSAPIAVASEAVAESSAEITSSAGIAASATAEAASSAAITASVGIAASATAEASSSAAITASVNIAAASSAKASSAANIGITSADTIEAASEAVASSAANITTTVGIQASASAKAASAANITSAGTATIVAASVAVARSAVNITVEGDGGAPYRLVPNLAITRRAARNPTLRR